VVFFKEDTIAPILSKVFTEKKHSLSPAVDLGINPFPLSILPGQFTFLPLTQLHRIRNLIPFARYNVPLIQKDDAPSNEDISESVARVAGYIASRDTYVSLKSELIRVLEQQNCGDAYGEFRRIERRSVRRWLEMDRQPDIERADSITSDHDSVRGSRSGESAKAESVSSEQSKSSASLEGQVQNEEKGDATFRKVVLKREVGGWWGRKTAD
jgi:hypothetical protein